MVNPGVCVVGGGVDSTWKEDSEQTEGWVQTRKNDFPFRLESKREKQKLRLEKNSLGKNLEGHGYQFMSSLSQQHRAKKGATESFNCGIGRGALVVIGIPFFALLSSLSQSFIHLFHKYILSTYHVQQILGDMKILPCRIKWFHCKVPCEGVRRTAY